MIKNVSMSMDRDTTAEGQGQVSFASYFMPADSHNEVI